MAFHQDVFLSEIGDQKFTSTTVLKGKNVAKIFAPVLVIILWNSLVFPRKILTSTEFYRRCAPDAPAPVVVKNQSPKKRSLFYAGSGLPQDLSWRTMYFRVPSFAKSLLGFEKRGLLEKGSFHKSPFSRDSREFRDSRDFREPPDSGKNKGESDHFVEILEILREILEIPSSEKTVFVVTPFAVPELHA